MYTNNDNPSSQPFDWLNAAEELGLTEAEADAYREKWETIEKQAKKYGLKSTYGALEMAVQLADEYGMEWLLKAIAKAVDVPKWAYVKGILKRAKQRGSIELPDREIAEEQNKWWNPNADRSALDEWGGLG